MSKMKSGYVAAKKHTPKGWMVRFDRKEPGDKPKSWYVKLRWDDPEPVEGSLMKFGEDLLKRLDDIGEFDCYQYEYEQTRDLSKPQFIPADTETGLDEPSKPLDIDKMDFIRMESYDQALFLFSRAYEICAENLPNLLEIDRPERLKKALVIAAELHMLSSQAVDGTTEYIKNFLGGDNK